MLNYGAALYRASSQRFLIEKVTRCKMQVITTDVQLQTLFRFFQAIIMRSASARSSVDALRDVREDVR